MIAISAFSFLNLFNISFLTSKTLTNSEVSFSYFFIVSYELLYYNLIYYNYLVKLTISLVNTSLY